MFEQVNGPARWLRTTAVLFSVALHWWAAAGMIFFAPVEMARPLSARCRLPAGGIPSLPGPLPRQLRPGGFACGVPSGASTIQLPVLVYKVEPDIFALRRTTKLRPGMAIFEAKIDVQGRITEMKVLRSLDPAVDQAAMKAIQKWRYRPARRNGRPVQFWMTVTVRLCA